MKHRYVPCTEQFLQEWDSYNGMASYDLDGMGSEGPEPAFYGHGDFTDYIYGDFDEGFAVPYYRVRFFIEAAALIPLAACLAASFSKKVDSFSLKIFCWNCVFVNSVFALFATLRFVMLEFVYPKQQCYYEKCGPDCILPNVESRTLYTPGYWLNTYVAEDIGRWTIYSMALSFLLLRYTTYRACVSPLTFKTKFNNYWWIVAVVSSDLIPAVIIPIANDDSGSKVDWKIRYSLMFALAGVIWTAECAITGISIVAILRYQLERKKSNVGPSNVSRLTSFMFFSILPCLQVAPSVYTTARTAVLAAQEMAVQECLEAAQNDPDYDYMQADRISMECGLDAQPDNL